MPRQCGGADVIVDGLGDGLGDSLDDGPGDAAREQNFAALAPCGHWISLGPATGGLESIDSSPLVQKSAFFLWPVIFACLSSPAPLL